MATAEGRSPDLAELLGTAILVGLPTDGEEQDHLAIVERTAQAEAEVRALLRQSVGAARAAGHSWATLGSVLGMSRQAAQQRFGGADEKVDALGAGEPGVEQRWLGPVTAFDEMPELAAAGRLGWRTVEAGILRHRMRRTPTQWEHRRVLWAGTRARYEKDGWQVGAPAFPWLYLVRDTGTPAERD